MARVPFLPPDALPEPIAEVYERYGSSYGPFRNQAAVLAHVPPALDHLASMLMELKDRQGVPWRYIELAIVVVAKLNACPYCVAHHTPMLQVEGLSADAIETLPETEHPDLDEIDKLVIEYATLVTNQPGQIREAVFDRLRDHFTDAQIVELTLRIALCGFFNRFNDALLIDDETGGVALPHGKPD